MRLRPPAGGVLDGAGGFGDGRLPTQGVDDRDEGPQVRQQVGAGAAGPVREGFVPEGVEGRAGEFGQARGQGGQGLGAPEFIPDFPCGGQGLGQQVRRQVGSQGGQGLGAVGFPNR
jgi:hypothetical protein